jgi:hypothetical protein
MSKRDSRIVVGIVLIVLGSWIVGKGFGKTGWMR